MTAHLISVTDRHGNTRTHRVNATDHDPRVTALVDEMIAELAAELQRHPDDVAAMCAGLLVEQIHDEAAYQRVATRRGLLAL